MSTVTSAADSEHQAAAGLTELFREHHLELVRLALLMVGDRATAEDVVQDVFERLHRRWHRLHEPANGLAYARSSVLNACRSVHRRSAVARKHVPGSRPIPRHRARTTRPRSPTGANSDRPCWHCRAASGRSWCCGTTSI
jgi:DNA-directed RNA polymerase specialized sigma24 family protein